MAGQGISRKRKTLPRRYRPGALAKADQRSREVRHAAARLEQLHADQGGTAEMPAVLQSVAERFVFVEAQAAAQEIAAIEGGPFDLAGYLSTVGVLAKLADRLGYQRRARRVPSLREALEQHAKPPVAGGES